MLLTRFFRNFSTKTQGFYWNDINPCVKVAQYAVRGVVPTQANVMQN